MPERSRSEEAQGAPGGLQALAAELRAQPGTLGQLARAAAVPGTPAATPTGAPIPDGGPARLAAAGPRAQRAPERYELLMDLILEGSLLHYGQGRLVHPDDPDLGLLLGDQLYALGLTHLAELGDLEAVAELADLISLISQAALAGQDELAQSLWRASAVAVGWGGDPEHERAKALARAGSPQARERLEAWACKRRALTDA